MKPTLIRTLLAVAVSGLFLTACDKKPAEPPATEAKTETTASAPSAESATPQSQAADGMPAEIEKLLIKSPYMDFTVNANRTYVIADIGSKFQLTPEQSACLHSLEGNPNYLAALEPYTKGILSEAEIKEADEFFSSDVGRKVAQVALAQLGAQNLPPLPEPTTEEKKQIAEAFAKPFFVKVKAKQDAMSEQEALNFLAQMADKEKTRCNIS